MALAPQKAREIVFQILYSHSFEPMEEGEMISFFMQELKVTRKSVAESCARVLQVAEKRGEIEEKIKNLSTEYSFERISRVERTILLLGMFELFHDESLPPKVALAEAVRLCRKFGTPESANFVNAILDKAYVDSNRNEPAPL